MLGIFKSRGPGERPPGGGPRAKQDRPKTQWYSVSLVPGERACAAVKYLARKRWLSAEAPRFPVARCDVSTCSCRYAHHPDRRAGPRRWTDRQSLPRQHEGQERRGLRKDRRQPPDPER